MTNPKSSPKSPPSQTRSSPSARPKSKSAQSPAPALLRTRFSAPQLLPRFHKLLPSRLLASWLALGNHLFYERAFSPRVTLWYLVHQRLADKHCLTQVLEDALAGGADRLSPRGKPLSRQLRSEATASYSDARQRLPVEVCRRTLWHTATQTIDSIKGLKWFGLEVGLIDGSTCRSRPYGDIPKHFPAHRPGNCKKPPYWCLARTVGMLSLATGVVLDSAMGALSASEQALSALLLAQRSWAGWLLVGDRNFGVYSVARAFVGAQAQALLRLTQARALKLARSAGLKLAPGLDALITWSASSHDQCPEGLAPDPIQGRLIALRVSRPGFRSFTLYLFTTLTDSLHCPAEKLAQLYAQRWKIELCFRYIKTQMELGFLQCHSADMLRKEWLAGLIAYNLIRWTMAAAAALAQVPIELLSFSRARELLLGWLTRSSTHRSKGPSWKRLLGRIAKALLPKRRKRRPSEPRAIRAFQKDFAKLEGSRAAARRKLAKTNANS